MNLTDGRLKVKTPWTCLTSLRPADDTRKRAVGVDTCKMVDGDAVIGGKKAADVEVTCAVL
jgi:hypothetical protein